MFSPQEIFVFLGPTLSHEEARGVLDATYFPPAQQSDILSLAVQFQPKVIALIDGYFMQSLSVWHKEILYALNKGIIVLGASSMGALRGAETADFGMIGVGKIYDLYRQGEINDDDEVVLVHGPAEENYLPLSLPLVNIRFTLKKASQVEKISDQICAEILAAAQSLYYPDRTILQIAKRAGERGLSQDQVAAWLQTYYVDQKKEDALLLLEKIKTLSADLQNAQDFAYNDLFRTLYAYDRRSWISSTSLSQREIAHYVALHHSGYSDLQYRALNQLLVNFLAKLLKIEVTGKEIEEEKKKFCLHNALLFLSDEEWKAWLSSNHLTYEEFNQLMKERAETRKLQLYISQGETPWRQTQALLNELKLNNSYEEWSKKAALQQELLMQTNPCYLETDQRELYGEELVEAHLNATGWRPDCIYPEWAKVSGFHDVDELRSEMLKAKIIRDFQRKSCEEGSNDRDESPTQIP